MGTFWLDFWSVVNSVHYTLPKAGYLSGRTRQVIMMLIGLRTLDPLDGSIVPTLLMFSHQGIRNRNTLRTIISIKLIIEKISLVLQNDWHGWTVKDWTMIEDWYIATATDLIGPSEDC